MLQLSSPSSFALYLISSLFSGSETQNFSINNSKMMVKLELIILDIPFAQEEWNQIYILSVNIQLVNCTENNYCQSNMNIYFKIMIKRQIVRKSESDLGGPSKKVKQSSAVKKIKYNTGDRYVGELSQAGARQGYGTFYYTNGNRYQGQWKDNQREGRGKLILLEGYMYIGQFKNNKRNGIGTFFWNDQSHYSGEWVNDMKHGIGTYQWSNGFKYQGQFKNDIREGKGVCIWPDGKKMQLQCRNDQQHGIALLTDTKGNRFQKVYQNGQLKSTRKL